MKLESPIYDGHKKLTIKQTERGVAISIVDGVGTGTTMLYFSDLGEFVQFAENVERIHKLMVLK